LKDCLKHETTIVVPLPKQDFTNVGRDLNETSHIGLPFQFEEMKLIRLSYKTVVAEPEVQA